MTTSNPTARPAPTKPRAYSEFAHGPIAAALNASFWTLFLTTIGKFLGMPPWVPLASGALLTVCLVWAGKHRQPRPLSRASLVFRGTTMMTVGTWSWWQLATFPAPDMNPSQTGIMLIAWPATIAAVYAAIVAYRVPLLLRLVGSGFIGFFTLVLTAVMWHPVSAWLDVVMHQTDRLAWGPAHIGENSMWIGKSFLELAVISGCLTVLGVAFGNRERSADEELAQADRDAAPNAAVNSRQAQQMRRVFSDLANEYTEWTAADGGKIKVANLKITEVRPWANGAGETYVFDLTGNTRGTTRKRMRTYCDDVATKLNLPEGCGVEVIGEKGMTRGTAAVEVCRVNVLDQILEYPEIVPRSIMNPLPIGKTRSGKEIGPFFRESSAFVWGQKGSGKTVTIFDIIAGGVQCTDCLVWVIDLNGGSAAAPFLQSWYDGEVDRPCVDWVATTMAEVVDMATVGREIALDRKVYYRNLKRNADVNLMPVGNGTEGQPPPEILIVIDEGKTILSPKNVDEDTRAAQAALMEIMDLARDAAVNIVFSGLRATADVADPAFKAGTAIRIGMRVRDSQELAYGFGDYNLDPDEAPYQGSGFVCVGYEESSIQVFKAYYLSPHRIEVIGQKVTEWRPYLDARGLVVAGDIYADRWRRTAHRIWPDPPERVRFYGSSMTPSDQPATHAAPASTATAVLDRDDDFDISAGLADPIGGDEGFDGMMRNANRNVDLERHNRRMREAGRPVDGEEPPPDDVVAPAGGGDDEEGLTPAEIAKRDQAEIDRKLREIEANMTVLPSDPRNWPQMPMPVDAELRAAPAGSREILERLVLSQGPIGWEEMHTLLGRGGDWGPKVPITKGAMRKLLFTPGRDSKEPVAWLVKRAKGDPYDHKDRKK
jgi:hypothetical protein